MIWPLALIIAAAILAVTWIVVTFVKLRAARRAMREMERLTQPSGWLR